MHFFVQILCYLNFNCNIEENKNPFCTHSCERERKKQKFKRIKEKIVRREKEREKNELGVYKGKNHIN